MLAEAQRVILNQYASNILAAGVHGDLLKQQALDLCEKMQTRLIKTGYAKNST
jgi:hypothetical protein